MHTITWKTIEELVILYSFILHWKVFDVLKILINSYKLDIVNQVQ